MAKSSVRFSLFSLVLILCLVFSCQQQKENAAVEKEAAKDLKLDEIPAVVMDALMAKFPQAEIHQWTQEKEGDIVVYDIEFTQAGRKFEADIKADGTIHNWEKEISTEELPEAARKAVEEMYPQAVLGDIMEITQVTGQEDVLEGYEVILQTAEKGEVEVTVSADGKILED
jgi:hypothetical protein